LTIEELQPRKVNLPGSIKDFKIMIAQKIRDDTRLIEAGQINSSSGASDEGESGVEGNLKQGIASNPMTTTAAEDKGSGSNKEEEPIIDINLVNSIDQPLKSSIDSPMDMGEIQ
jgi:hypothetical protein